MGESHAADALIIHVLSLDNHRTDVVFGLLGKRQSLLWQGCNLHIRAVGSTGALDRDAHGTHVLHGDGVGACLGIVVFGDADRVACCTRGVAGERIGGLSRDAGYDDLIDLSCRAVATVVVQIEIDVVFIFADESTGEFSPGELQRIAGVILQGDVGRCRLLAVQIGVRSVGDQLVCIAVYVEVALADFRILSIEVGRLLGGGTPARGVVGLPYLYGNRLCSVVVETDDDGDGTVTARLLEVAEVVHPLSVAAVEGIGLLVQAVVEIAPCSIFVFIAATVLVVDDDNLCVVDDFFARRDVHGSIDNLTEHVEPDATEVGECAPVATGVAFDGGVAQVLEILGPDELRSVPYSSTVDAGLFHHGSNAGGTRIFLSVILA